MSKTSEKRASRNKKIKAQRRAKKRARRNRIILISVIAVVLIAVAVVIGIKVYKNNSNGDDAADRPEARSAALLSESPLADGKAALERGQYGIVKTTDTADVGALLQKIRIRDEQAGAYQIIVRDEGTDKYFELNYWMEDGVGVYEYIFGGLGDTELEGVYYRDNQSITDYQTGTVHTDDQFYTAHRNYLSSLTLDNMLADMLSKVFSQVGENSDGNTVIEGDNVSICLSEDMNKICIIDQSGETAIGYYIVYGQKYALPEISTK